MQVAELIRETKQDFLTTANECVTAFFDGWKKETICRSRKECIRHDKAMRDQLNEEQIDNMINDSFPASDPATLY